MNFCPKCGNDVRGAKFCSKCGNPVNEQISGGQNATVFPEKKGFFQQRKENKDARHKKAANECSRQMAAAFIAEKERFREKEALEKELAIFDECQKDGNSEIWINPYNLVRFLRSNQSEAVKKENSKEWTRVI